VRLDGSACCMLSNIVRLLDVLESTDGEDLYLVFDFYGEAS
jgi:hypothetical protein